MAKKEKKRRIEEFVRKLLLALGTKGSNEEPNKQSQRRVKRQSHSQTSPQNQPNRTAPAGLSLPCL